MDLWNAVICYKITFGNEISWDDAAFLRYNHACRMCSLRSSSLWPSTKSSFDINDLLRLWPFICLARTYEFIVEHLEPISKFLHTVWVTCHINWNENITGIIDNRKYLTNWFIIHIFCVLCPSPNNNNITFFIHL